MPKKNTAELLAALRPFVTFYEGGTESRLFTSDAQIAACIMDAYRLPIVELFVEDFRRASEAYYRNRRKTLTTKSGRQYRIRPI